MIGIFSHMTQWSELLAYLKFTKHFVNMRKKQKYQIKINCGMVIIVVKRKLLNYAILGGNCMGNIEKSYLGKNVLY